MIQHKLTIDVGGTTLTLFAPTINDAALSLRLFTLVPGVVDVVLEPDPQSRETIDELAKAFHNAGVRPEFSAQPIKQSPKQSWTPRHPKTSSNLRSPGTAGRARARAKAKAKARTKAKTKARPNSPRKPST